MHDGVLAKLAATVTRGVERSDVIDNVLDKCGGQGLLTEGGPEAQLSPSFTRKVF